MSTNCRIGVYNSDDHTTSSISCHFDGHLDGVGMALLTEYNTYALACALVAGGNELGAHRARLGIHPRPAGHAFQHHGT